MAKKTRLQKKQEKRKKRLRTKNRSLPNSFYKPRTIEDHAVLEQTDDANMSAVIRNFLQPLFEERGGEENVDDSMFRLLAAIAQIAWNVALLPDAKQEKQKEEFIDILQLSNAIDIGTAYHYVDLLIERKKKLFPHFKRVVVRYEIISEKELRHFHIASAVQNN
jgi:hypothetical protein